MKVNFTNLPLDLGELPSPKEEDFNGLDIRFKKVLLIESIMIAFVIIGVCSSYWIMQVFFEIEYHFKIQDVFGTILGVLMGCVRIAVIRKGFSKKGFILREQDLIYRTGLIHIKTTVVPYTRIQHVRASEGILMQYFGLSKLIFFTAGSSYGDLVLPGLSKEEATRIRNYVMERMENRKEGQEIPEVVHQEECYESE